MTRSASSRSDVDRREWGARSAPAAPPRPPPTRRRPEDGRRPPPWRGTSRCAIVMRRAQHTASGIDATRVSGARRLLSPVRTEPARQRRGGVHVPHDGEAAPRPSPPSQVRGAARPRRSSVHLATPSGPTFPSMAAEVSSPDPSRLADIGRLDFVPGDDDVRVVVDDCVHYVRVVGRFASCDAPVRVDPRSRSRSRTPRAASTAWRGSWSRSSCGSSSCCCRCWSPRPCAGRSGDCPGPPGAASASCAPAAPTGGTSAGLGSSTGERADDRQAALERVAELADEIRAGRWPHPDPGLRGVRRRRSRVPA